MRILFCGSMVPEKVEYQVKDISAAGNRFQNNIIYNLRKMGHEVIECSFLGMNIPEETRQILHGNYVIKDDNILKSIREYRKLLKEAIGDTDIAVCYNITYAWFLLPFLSKKEKKKCIVILADYSDVDSYISIVMKLYAKMQLFSMRRFDAVVGLSANIRKILRKKQKFMLMEGGIDRELYESFVYMPHKKGKPLVFMYSGLLTHVTGVDLLLRAMSQIQCKNIRLMISGKGDLEEEIREAEKRDNRIHFLGHLQYEEYIRQLQEANVLINPRNMELPENQNNFPSKIMDYLATGKIIISTKFVGWKKFSKNILFCESSAEELMKCMICAEKWLIDESTIYEDNRKQAEKFLWDKQLKRMFDEIIASDECGIEET